MKKVENKKEGKKKFDVKAWLIASIFSMLSAALGIANLILHFVDKN